MDYVRRVLDDQLDRLLVDLPAIAIEGPRAVGKTTTATRRATTVLALVTRQSSRSCVLTTGGSTVCQVRSW